MFINEVINYAKESFLRFGESPLEFIVYGTKDRVVAPVSKGLPFTSAQRLEAVANIGVEVALRKNVGELIEIFSVGSAWMTRSKAGDIPRVRPSLDPSRKEILIISSLNAKSNEQRMWQFKITRDKGGKLTLLEPIADSQGAKVFGPLLPEFVKGYNIISH